MPTQKQRDLPLSERILLGVGELMKSDKAKKFEAKERQRVEQETRENEAYKRIWGIDKPRK